MNLASRTPAAAEQASRGVYVHFPWCHRRCPYCDFVLTTAREPPSEAYTDAVLAELAHRRATEWDGPLATLYVGGGTPSLWAPQALARLVDALNPALTPGAERTLEANPEQVDDAWLAATLSLGFNRLSLGVQSLDARGLTALGRSHGPTLAEAALDRLANAHARGALGSFSVDLIYGWRDGPDAQGLDDLQAELEGLIRRWSPPHISCYALTVEPKTVLGRRVRDGLTPAPDDALQAEMLFFIRDFLARHGYLHYEVSSFARPGALAVHNARYWDLRPWLGLGAGAAGFTGTRRYRNQPVIRRYLAAPADATEAESEPLGPADLAFDAVMTGLRRLDVGLAWTPTLGHYFDAPLHEAVAAGQLLWRDAPDGPRVRVTDHGLRYLDDVLASFLAALDGAAPSGLAAPAPSAPPEQVPPDPTTRLAGLNEP